MAVALSAAAVGPVHLSGGPSRAHSPPTAVADSLAATDDQTAGGPTPATYPSAHSLQTASTATTLGTESSPLTDPSDTGHEPVGCSLNRLRRDSREPLPSLGHAAPESAAVCAPADASEVQQPASTAAASAELSAQLPADELMPEVPPMQLNSEQGSPPDGLAAQTSESSACRERPHSVGHPQGWLLTMRSDPAIGVPSGLCAVPIAFDDAGAVPAAAAESGEPGSAAAGPVAAPADGISAAAEPMEPDCAAVSGEPTADLDPTAADAEDAAEPVDVGPNAAALAAWESVGNMLSDDEQSAQEEDDGDVHTDAVTANSEAHEQAPSGKRSRGQAGAAEQRSLARALLPGEQSLEELGATLLYEKILSDSDTKASVQLPKVRRPFGLLCCLLLPCMQQPAWVLVPVPLAHEGCLRVAGYATHSKPDPASTAASSKTESQERHADRSGHLRSGAAL